MKIFTEMKNEGRGRDEDVKDFSVLTWLDLETGTFIELKTWEMKLGRGRWKSS